MQFLEIQSLDKTSVPLPLSGAINCFLDTADQQYKGIDSHGVIFLLHDINPANTLQQITDAGATTTQALSIGNLQIDLIAEYIDNAHAIAANLNIGDLYRLPHNQAGNFSALAVVGPVM